VSCLKDIYGKTQNVEAEMVRWIGYQSITKFRVLFRVYRYSGVAGRKLRQSTALKKSGHPLKNLP
jgi:hypothetical protein